MGVDLREPSGSWYHGPYADSSIAKGIIAKDRAKHGRNKPLKVPGITVERSTWGTSGWFSEQTANTSRFDYLLFPKERKLLDGRAEIRRLIVPKGAQSGSSDHLPVDGKFWLKEKSWWKRILSNFVSF